jgi:hypothetical protein
MRHLNAWRDGQDMDPESGISHIAHIVSSCNILLDAGHCGTLQDDRNKKPVAKAEADKDESVAIDQRVLPIPSGWNLPPVPKGYNRWVYRGTFKGHTIVAKDRHVLYDFEHEDGDWHKTIYFSGNFHHIEAVKDESIALDGLLPFPPVPEGYDRWVYRGKGWSSDKPTKYAYRWPHDKQWNCAKGTAPVGYEGTHYIEAVKDESVAPDKPPTYPPVPVGYDRWVYRGKGWKTDRRVCFAAATSPYIEWVVYKNGCTVGYESTHYIEAVKD